MVLLVWHRGATNSPKKEDNSKFAEFLGWKNVNVPVFSSAAEWKESLLLCFDGNVELEGWSRKSVKESWFIGLLV